MKDGAWPKVEPHYAASPVPSRELVRRSCTGIAWPDARVFVVLGGKSPSISGTPTLATHIAAEFAAGQFAGCSNDELQWISRQSWDHLVWVGDAVTRLAQVAPGYFAVVLAHELEHVRVACESSATAALEILVQIAAGKAEAGVPYAEFPHEIRCDVAGLRHAAHVYGREELADQLARLRAEDSRTEKLLLYLEGDLEPPDSNLHEELLRFVDQHSLHAQMSSLWDAGENEQYTRHLDRDDFASPS